jgi:hypothetical protein
MGRFAQKSCAPWRFIARFDALGRQAGGFGLS